MMEAHAERHRYPLGRKILNTGATFQDKVELRTLFGNARRQIRPQHAKAKVPEGHPSAESQEVVLEQDGPTGRSRRKRFEIVRVQGLQEQFEIPCTEARSNFWGRHDADSGQRINSTAIAGDRSEDITPL